MLEIDIMGIKHTFNDDLPYGELLNTGERTHELWGIKMVAALSHNPKLTIEAILAFPSKKVTDILATVLNNYSKDFPKPPKEKEE